jgi:aminocarboxymuconate-semialdehyde decarboxylase
MLRYVAEVLPVEHIMLGSDAPFPLGEPHPVAFVRGALPALQAKLVLEESFERLTGG